MVLCEMQQMKIHKRLLESWLELQRELVSIQAAFSSSGVLTAQGGFSTRQF